MDLKSREKWVEYSKAKDDMCEHTDLEKTPWWVVEADDKKKARLNCISHLLSMVHYKDLTPQPIQLPPRQKSTGYERPPHAEQNFVPHIY